MNTDHLIHDYFYLLLMSQCSPHKKIFLPMALCKLCSNGPKTESTWKLDEFLSIFKVRIIVRSEVQNCT